MCPRQSPNEKQEGAHAVAGDHDIVARAKDVIHLGGFE